MIGRADIEGSKSNVAMNAWLPQASYPCGTIIPVDRTMVNSLGSRLVRPFLLGLHLWRVRLYLKPLEGTDCHLVVELHPYKA